MLILVAMLVFGIFGIAALSVDLGIARLTQAQMQATADAAALQGARGFGEAGQRTAAQTLVTGSGATAGPNLSVTGGYGDFNFSASLVLETPSVYQPALELNSANEPHGDMVTGSFSGGSPLEANDYSRTDFTPDPAGSAFLVRLRRTADRQLLDNIPGVSSAGSALPLLFGHGSLYMGTMRADGITVRSTAIADSLPAVSVNTVAGFPPVTSFVLSAAFFNTFRSDPPPASVTIDSNGLITPLGGGLAVGRFAAPANTIGQPIATIATPPNPVLTGYAALYESIGPASLDRIVGFGYVTLGGSIGTVAISAQPNRADRHLGTALPAAPRIPLDEWTEVVAANRALRSAAKPVLVR